MRDHFLNIVHSNYWHYIEEGQLPRKSDAVNILIGSISVALDQKDHEEGPWTRRARWRLRAGACGARAERVWGPGR